MIFSQGGGFQETFEIQLRLFTEFKLIAIVRRGD
jgi:hypothetical protein